MEGNNETTTCDGTWIERLPLDPDSKDRVLICSGCGEWLFIDPRGRATSIGALNIR